MSELERDPGFALLLRRLKGRGLPALEIYKERCLRRRLAVRMRACGVKTLADYASLLDRQPAEVEHLLEALTIQVTGFFRNPEVWARLESAMRSVLRPDQQRLAAWSAGCATGEEAWTTAMVLIRTAEGGGLAIGPAQVRVDATDVDPGSLAIAREGCYPDPAFRDAPDPLLSRWLDPIAGGRRVRAGLRRLVRFRRHDLAEDSPPQPPYDLVVCRNVLIYFSRAVQERLFVRFADALRPGGLLLLGKVESLHGAGRERFETVDGRERLFRRAS